MIVKSVDSHMFLGYVPPSLEFPPLCGLSVFPCTLPRHMAEGRRLAFNWCLRPTPCLTMLACGLRLIAGGCSSCDRAVSHSVSTFLSVFSQHLSCACLTT